MRPQAQLRQSTRLSAREVHKRFWRNFTTSTVRYLCGLTFEVSGRRRQDARPEFGDNVPRTARLGPGGLPAALRLTEGLGRTWQVYVRRIEQFSWRLRCRQMA